MNTAETTARPPARSPSRAAERMRCLRKRRRRGVRCVEILVNQVDIEALVHKRLLDPARREDGEAIQEALHDLLFSLWADGA